MSAAIATGKGSKGSVGDLARPFTTGVAVSQVTSMGGYIWAGIMSGGDVTGGRVIEFAYR